MKGLIIAGSVQKEPAEERKAIRSVVGGNRVPGRAAQDFQSEQPIVI